MAGSRRFPRRWLVLIGLIVVAFILGYIGFRDHAAALQEDRSRWDLVYLTVQLFFLESGAIEAPIGLELQIARFLAPVTTATTVVLATMALFALQFQRALLWVRGGHVIVCGLGRKGARLVAELRAQGRQVVVMEHDRNNDSLDHCRDLGAVVLLGSANDEWTLQQCFVDRAASLISVTGQDGVNVETAVLAHQLNAKRFTRRHLQCVVHVGEPKLQQLFKQHRIYGDANDRFELEFFNIFEVAARAMLREPPVLWSVDDQPPHLVVVGFGNLGEALVRRALQDWQIDHPGSSARPRITVIDAKAAAAEERFQLRYPTLMPTGAWQCLDLDIHSAEFAKGSFLRDEQGAVDVTAVYVCLDSDSNAMSAALTLRQLLAGQSVPIVVRMSEDGGLATFLVAGSHGDAVIDGIHPVGLLDLTCTTDMVLGGTREVVAQTIHQAYLYDRLGAGEEFGSSASLVSWEDLPDDLKESNRRQFDHTHEKLHAIGCEMVPNTDDHLPVIEFTEEQVERLGQMEHDRWVAERLEMGWRQGETKDDRRKITPYLVPWDELTEELKDYDRNFVRRLPANLAKADYEIQRIESSPGQGSQR